ncbi:(2Fe-2S)-binding protein [Paenibacillus allorhizosphaerae]|uniref:Nicotinate dehydrogenase small FeS subunit n=1 Tax=Paenibacillus allorhizosphaerae TaxID=2849866 RepID=A0ABM8VA96_9BACL|nr:(2Fe-2S)-binding protein [Paenibacillus allorhizosphaerae]CAG7615882.1 Nicotinate dehydrogenase small FeS subunit [Paenibacillus allorhizosphaerae]
MPAYDAAHYSIHCEVNGERRTIRVRAAEVLLHVLRAQLGLTGAKPGCNNGDCGACTILVNGLPVKSCLMLAVEANGQRVTTIEGLDRTPVQQAFAQKQAFQCGYCTSGFIMNCHGLLNAHPNADERSIQLWLESNICRCTSYEEIHEVVKTIFTLHNNANMSSPGR